MGKRSLISSILIFMMAACSLPGTEPSATATTSAGALAVTAVPIITETITPTPTLLEPTETSTPSQPVFDPSQVGDLNNLNSYVITIHSNGWYTDMKTKERHSGISEDTITVINNPYQLKRTNHSTSINIVDNSTREANTDWYTSNGISYQYSHEGKFWSIKSPDQKELEYYFPGYQVQYIKTAHFVGQEEFKGIPANHFVFGEADIQLPTPTPGTPAPETKYTAEGNIFLAVNGNYLLHFDQKAITKAAAQNNGSLNDGSDVLAEHETLFELSSLNQVGEITIPPDLPTQVKLETDVPLPPDAVLRDVMAFPGSTRFDYDYNTSMNDDEILAFYHDMQPQNGWKADTIAKDPDGSGGLIILKKDNNMVIININYFDWDKQWTVSFQYQPQ